MGMVRIVKLTFKNEEIATFIEIFEQVREKIRSADGCLSLSLLQDKSDPCIFMTYSFWEGPEFLQQYRRSELFKKVWTDIKPLFDDKPEAWSLDEKFKS